MGEGWEGLKKEEEERGLDSDHELEAMAEGEGR